MIISLFYKSIQQTNSYELIAMSFANKSLSMTFELQNKNKRYFNYLFLQFYMISEIDISNKAFASIRPEGNFICFEISCIHILSLAV